MICSTNVVIPVAKSTKSKIQPNHFKKLPEPLKPTKYVPKSKPAAKPQAKRRILSKRPVLLPSSTLPKSIDAKVQRLIREITPYYQPEAIRQFQKLLGRSIKTQITEKSQALKNNVKTFSVLITNKKDQANHFNITKLDVSRELENVYNTKGAFEFFITIKVNFKKLNIEDGEQYYTFKDAYFNSNAITILNANEINGALNEATEQILNKVAEWISKASGWVIELLISHFINTVKYIPLRGRSYIPLPEELQNNKKGLINLKNNDNECFRWCHVRYLNPAVRNPQRITKKTEYLQKR